MLLGGLWHGASWNFVIWGGLNGLYLSLEKAASVSLSNPRHYFLKFLRMLYVFLLINFTWIFFRAETFGQAKQIVQKIIFFFNPSEFNFLDINIFISIIISMLILLGLEYFIFRKYSFEHIYKCKNGNLKLSALSIFLIVYIFLFGNSNGSQFIYFQF